MFKEIIPNKAEVFLLFYLQSSLLICLVAGGDTIILLIYSCGIFAIHLIYYCYCIIITITFQRCLVSRPPIKGVLQYRGG